MAPAPVQKAGKGERTRKQKSQVASGMGTLVDAPVPPSPARVQKKSSRVVVDQDNDVSMMGDQEVEGVEYAKEKSDEQSVKEAEAEDDAEDQVGEKKKKKRIRPPKKRKSQKENTVSEDTVTKNDKTRRQRQKEVKTLLLASMTPEEREKFREEKKRKKKLEKERENSSDYDTQEEEPAEFSLGDENRLSRSIKDKDLRRRGVWRLDDGSDNEYRGPTDPERSIIEWESVTLLGGASERERTNKVQVEISQDGRFVFHPVASLVHIYSLPELTPVSALFPPTSLPSRSMAVSPPILPGEVTSISLHPENPLQLLVAYSSGFIFVWDWVDGTVLNVINIQSVLSKEDGERSNYGKSRWDLLIARGSAGKMKNQMVVGATEKTIHKHRALRSFVVLLLISESIPSNSNSNSFHLFPLTQEFAVQAICHSYHHTVILTSTSILILRPENQLHLVAHIENPGRGTLSSLSVCRPLQEPEREKHLELAVSDLMGKIYIIAFNLPSNATFHQQMSVPARGLHWHAHPCKLSPNFNEASPLLSIGEEAVLVRWPLNPNNFEHRDFIPRLGAQGSWIYGTSKVHLGANKEEARETVVGLNDGSVIWVSDRQVKRRLGNVKLIAKSTCSTTPLALHNATSTLIFPSSHTAALQFFSPTLNSNLFELTVASTNRIARRNEDEIAESVVEHASISDEVVFKKEGAVRWMATMERWQDREERFSEESCLKIWKVKGNSFEFRVNTMVDHPHPKPLTTLAFSKPIYLRFAGLVDRVPLLLTTSEDGQIKTWALDGNTRGSSWRCRSSIVYRDFPALGAAFSRDGTMYAVAHGVVVTIWDTVTNAMVHSLGSQGIDARYVQFVGSDNLCLVSGGRNGAIGWDLRSWEAIWVSPDPVSTILEPKTSSPLFVLLSTDTVKGTRTKIKVVRVTSTPSFDVRKFSYPDSIKSALIYSFDPTTYAILLACITTTNDLVMLGEGVKDHVQNASARDLTTVSNGVKARKSLFEEIYGTELTVAPNEQILEVPDASEWRKLLKRKERVEKVNALLETPSHLLPPVSMWWKNVLEANLDTKEAEGEEEMKVDNVELAGEEKTSFVEEEMLPPVVVVEKTERDDKEMAELIKRIFAVQLTKAGKIEV